jgi:hypothetical protein
MAIEHRVHGADGRKAKVNVAVAAADLLADLRRPQARMLLAQPNNQLLDLEGQTVGVSIRTARWFGQSFDTAVLVAREDLVASLARDIETLYGSL